MIGFLRHFFTPHHTNNQRARILHHDIVLIFSLAFIFFTLCLSSVKNYRPDVLGIAVNISSQDLLSLTNQQRQNQGLNPLSYNPLLELAAKLKAEDMFHDNYWAHISPITGRTPWVFIQKAGYKYIYAGENLARGFTNPKDAVAAWMASPTHRANVLSPNYQDVGFFVESGTLTGEPDTVLIVEMFGGNIAPSVYGINPPGSKQVLSDKNNVNNKSYPSYSFTPLIDRFSLSKNIAQIFLVIFISILLLDAILIKRKNISRIVGHNLDHLLFLGGIFLILILIKTGIIF